MSFALLDLVVAAKEKGEGEERGGMNHVKKNTAHAYLFLHITRPEAACGAAASFFFFTIALRYNCTARIMLMPSRKFGKVRMCLHSESPFVGASAGLSFIRPAFHRGTGTSCSLRRRSCGEAFDVTHHHLGSRTLPDLRYILFVLDISNIFEDHTSLSHGQLLRQTVRQELQR